MCSPAPVQAIRFSEIPAHVLQMNACQKDSVTLSVQDAQKILSDAERVEMLLDLRCASILGRILHSSLTMRELAF